MRKVSVCLSVRLSVKRMHCDKTEEDFSILLYHMKDHSAQFSEKSIVGGATRHLKFGLNRSPLERNRRF